MRCPQRIFSRVATVGAFSAEDSGLYRIGSGSIGLHDLTGIWPVFGSVNKTGANRILKYVLPLLSVTLIAPQQMIIKARLPKRAQFLAQQSRRFASHEQQNAVQFSLQPLDPRT